LDTYKYNSPFAAQMFLLVLLATAAVYGATFDYAQEAPYSTLTRPPALAFCSGIDR
jgi:hypothetical protein